MLPSKVIDSCFAVTWEEYAHQCMSWCHWAPALLGSDIQLHEGSGYTGDCSRHCHADSCPCLRMSSYTVSMYLQHIWWKFRSLYLALNGQLLHNTQSHMQVASEWNSVNQNACIQCQTQLPPPPSSLVQSSTMSSSASYKLPVQNSPNHKQKYNSPFITQITLMSLPQQNNNNKTPKLGKLH